MLWPQISMRYYALCLQARCWIFLNLLEYFICRVGWTFDMLNYIMLPGPSSPLSLLSIWTLWRNCFCKRVCKTFSALYGTLLITDFPKIDRLWDQWQMDIPSLDREDWEDCLEHCPKLVISSRDKLIQTKCLHQVYFMPGRMSKMYPDRRAYCPCCHTQMGKYFHMFWECPKIQAFLYIFELINLRLDLSIPMSPELALPGISDDAQRTHHSKLFFSYLLFYTNKAIICKWSSSAPPTL